ncbi:FAD-dependent oxidoreductase [Allonocardiopsis opalescens]|uniref:2-polyprenyl-6-methoxyphenol hydroxylase-like FAD-dependent oxidoreductase n=1 Tax=Allonocardiopsis opalescens TaxID=1144618 RepID=A0A2T0Q9W4_9ACTN|nr:FAD-dependent oxidoreductase [Allonocardiopsis opalescens]PRY00686.1 2-polyprenyl-6-methoxyphenol hydroxylase-like FAD-dependent oxidoreductase [Allonocardiopsis opalescens]
MATNPDSPTPATTTCAIAGGGPAGVMLGLLLARAGVDVTVLEKHGDFLRDFRGDTVHPSTLAILGELGLSEEFERLPHNEVSRLALRAGDSGGISIDLSVLRGPYKYVAMVPQWDLLDLLVREASRYPSFHLLMNAEVTGVMRQGDRAVGLRYRRRDGAGGEHELPAALVVGADGRDSVVRTAAALRPVDFGAPMDVAWFRISRRPEDPSGVMGRIVHGAMGVAIDRSSYWQMAYIFPKGGFDELRARGIERFRERLRELFPVLGDRVGELADFERVFLLRVGVDRLRRWYREGLLCIGDAAHIMSPIGGVGINLAVQDAVATANITAGPLLAAQRDGTPLPVEPLARVQRRRAWPAVGTQSIQLLLQRTVIQSALAEERGRRLGPPPILAERRWVRALFANAMMVGLRPEHVRTPATDPAVRR